MPSAFGATGNVVQVVYAPDVEGNVVQTLNETKVAAWLVDDRQFNPAAVLERVIAGWSRGRLCYEPKICTEGCHSSSRVL
jgi:hypothetical protein